MQRMIKDPETGKFVKHKSPNICTIEGCTRKVRGHGLCNMHLLRWQRHGDVNFRKKKANGEVLYYIGKNGYKVLRNKHGRIYEHRYVMEHYLGRPLDDCEIIHHCDGNRLNNAINNLELSLISDHIRIYHSKR